LKLVGSTGTVETALFQESASGARLDFFSDLKSEGLDQRVETKVLRRPIETAAQSFKVLHRSGRSHYMPLKEKCRTKKRGCRPMTAFCHPAKLGHRPARLNSIFSDGAILFKFLYFQ
jgi:hypothetical protein